MEAMNWSHEPSYINADELLDLLGDDEESFLELEVASLMDKDLGAVSPTDAAQPVISNSSKQLAEPKKKSSFQRQKDEAAQLQYQVAELQAQLRRLQGSSRVSGALQSSTSSTKSTGFDQSIQKAALALSFWRVVAQRQLHERHQAEQENADLRDMLKEQALLAKSLEHAIRKRPLLMKAQHKSYSRCRTAIASQKDSEVFQVLLSNVEERMRTVETFLQEQNLTPTTDVASIVVVTKDQQNVHIERTNAQVMRFNLRALSKAMWMQMRMAEITLGATKSHSQVLKHTDELLITKHMMPVNACTESTFGSVTVFSVFKRVTREDKVLLVWERLVERTGPVAGGDPMIYVNFHGCGQLVGVPSEDQLPATLFQSHVRLVPVYVESHRRAESESQQQQKFDTEVFIKDLIAVHQQNAQKFMSFVQNAVAGGCL